MSRKKTSKQHEPRPAARGADAYTSGFFSAIISGPMVMPTEWLERFFGATQFESLSDLNSFSDRIMGHYNEIATELHQRPDAFIERTVVLCATDKSGDALFEWVRGFGEAVDFRGAKWKALRDDPRNDTLFTPLGATSDMASNPAKREWLRNADLRTNLARALGIMTVRMWELWRGKEQTQAASTKASQTAATGRKRPQGKTPRRR